MARFTATISTPQSQDAVWRYLADLRAICEWDPSVSAARLIEGAPGAMGTRYELDVGFLGRIVTLPYETVVSEPPHRIAFRAETAALSILDEAVVLSVPEGSSVTWDAFLRLKGARRLLELPLQSAFGRLGRRAERGLRERLAVPGAAAAVEGALR